MFKRCIEIYPCACTSDKVILKERFVLFYCSYLLNIFIFNVFCTISINHIVALCKNSVNDLCKIMLSLYTFVQARYVTPWLSTFFQKITKCNSAARRINEIPVSQLCIIHFFFFTDSIQYCNTIALCCPINYDLLRKCMFHFLPHVPLSFPSAIHLRRFTTAK